MTKENLEQSIEEMLRKDAEALVARAKVHVQAPDNKMWVNNPEFLTLLRVGATPFIMNSESGRGNYTQEVIYQDHRFVTSTKERLDYREVFTGPLQKVHGALIEEGFEFQGIFRNGSNEWEKYLSETVVEAAKQGVIQRHQIELGEGVTAEYLKRL